MKYVLTSFIKRIPREGFKSLSVPLLALVLVFLISIMGGVRERQAEELEYVIDNFEIRVEVSHPFSRQTSPLTIRDRTFNSFIDDENEQSLARFLRDVQVWQNFAVHPIGIHEHLNDLMLRGLPVFRPAPLIRVSAVSSLFSDPFLISGMDDTAIEFFEGFDESILASNAPVALVSEDILASMVTADNTLELRIWREPADVMTMPTPAFVGQLQFYADITLNVIGVVSNREALVVTPFRAMAEAWYSTHGSSATTMLMNAILIDNRTIDEFHDLAATFFVTPGNIDPRRTFALTVFDSTFHDVVRTLRENISLIDTMTPFIYVLSIAIGFLASFLLTRRRKPEFAIMRSIGVKKTDVFFGALTEQGLLCLVGAIIGCLLYLLVWGTFLPWVALLFTLFYTLGSAISAAKAAGADVLKILREKE